MFGGGLYFLTSSNAPPPPICFSHRLHRCEPPKTAQQALATFRAYGLAACAVVPRHDIHIDDWLDYYLTAGVARFYLFTGASHSLVQHLDQQQAETLLPSPYPCFPIKRLCLQSPNPSPADDTPEKVVDALKARQEQVRLFRLDDLTDREDFGEHCIRTNPDRAARILILEASDYVFPAKESVSNLDQHLSQTPDCAAAAVIPVTMWPFGPGDHAVSSDFCCRLPPHTHPPVAGALQPSQHTISFALAACLPDYAFDSKSRD